MANQILVGFGDSWAQGSGLQLPNEKTYLELAGQSLNLRTENYAVASSSAAHMLIQLREFIDNSFNPENQYHAVFFVTAKERSFYFDDNTKHIVNISPQSTRNNSTVQSSGYYQYYNEHLGDFDINRNILALQQMCKVYSIRDHWILGWQQVKLWPTVNHSKFINDGRPITTLFSRDNCFCPLLELVSSIDKNLYFTKCGHPNQHGHQMIADVLVKHIIDKVR
jgi:hypothetical protein